MLIVRVVVLGVVVLVLWCCVRDGGDSASGGASVVVLVGWCCVRGGGDSASGGADGSGSCSSACICGNGSGSSSGCIQKHVGSASRELSYINSYFTTLRIIKY